MAAKLAAINENFKTLQIKVTKNHIIPRFVVFSRHETVREGFVLYKVNVTQKSPFHGQIWLKNEKKEKS